MGGGSKSNTLINQDSLFFFLLWTQISRRVFTPVTKAMIYFLRAQPIIPSFRIYLHQFWGEKYEILGNRGGFIWGCLAEGIGPDPVAPVLFWWWRSLGSAGRGALCFSQMEKYPFLFFFFEWKNPMVAMFRELGTIGLEKSFLCSNARTSNKSQARWKSSRSTERWAGIRAWRSAVLGLWE